VHGVPASSSIATPGSGLYCFSAASLPRFRSINSKHRLFINPRVDFSGKSLKPCGRPRIMLAQSLYSPNTMSDRKLVSRETGVRYKPTTGAPKDSMSSYSSKSLRYEGNQSDLRSAYQAIAHGISEATISL